MINFKKIDIEFQKKYNELFQLLSIYDPILSIGNPIHNGCFENDPEMNFNFRTSHLAFSIKYLKNITLTQNSVSLTYYYFHKDVVNRIDDNKTEKFFFNDWDYCLIKLKEDLNKKISEE